MEEKEDKGFVVRDRRKVSLEDLDKEPAAGETKQEEKAEDTRPQETKEESQASGRNREESRMHLPEVSFATFVFSLSSSALVHLGEIPEPESKEAHVDLGMAKQIIDTLGMLHEKTKGNLDENEEHLMKSILYDLRMRYIQKSST